MHVHNCLIQIDCLIQVATKTGLIVNPLQPEMAKYVHDELVFVAKREKAGRAKIWYQ